MSALEALRKLHRQQALREVDMAFAELLQRSGAGADAMLAGALALRAVALGHSGFALHEAAALLEELGTEVSLPDLDVWTHALHADPLVTDGAALATAVREDRLRALRPLALVDGRVSLYRYAAYECGLARRLLRRHAERPERPAAEALDTVARMFECAPDAVLDDAQARAVWTALCGRLTLVTGGPGTGKTTTVARLLAVLMQSGADPKRIALAAPTGRAAARLSEAIVAAVRRDAADGRIDSMLATAVPYEAQTLHRLLGWRSGRIGFRHDATHPLPFDVVIVDEASMIDLPLMSKLLDAVAEDARLVLLGDPDQLPAVEAGHVFAALCDAAGSGPEPISENDGIAATGDDAPSLPRWPLASSRAHLSRSYRQREAPALTALAQSVQAGNVEAVARRLATTDDSLVRHEGDMAELESWMRRQWLPALLALGEAPDPVAALALARCGRVLTALRKGPFGAETWNAWFAHQLGGANRRWFHGQLLMITENSYRHGLFNGDTGIVWFDPQGEPWVWFDAIEQPWHPGQLPAHETAFASTVHKAQGSEFDRIVMLLPDRDSRVLGRELLYTGLTRARRRVDLWASEDAVTRSVARRTRRDTGLASWLSGRAGEGD